MKKVGSAWTPSRFVVAALPAFSESSWSQTNRPACRVRDLSVKT